MMKNVEIVVGHGRYLPSKKNYILKISFFTTGSNASPMALVFAASKWPTISLSPLNRSSVEECTFILARLA